MNNFKPVCFTTEDFISLEPIDIFHKENIGLKTDCDIKNYHCLARASYSKKCGQKAILRIFADDFYKLYINGKFVCQGSAPSYHFCSCYDELDITDKLSDGDNVIAVHLYYQGLINRVWQSGDNRFCICAEVNGEPLLWKYRVSNAYSGVINGYDTDFTECFDSRKWELGWSTAAYDDSDWKPMLEKKYDYHFVPRQIEQLSVYSIKPELVEKNKNGYFIDVGSEIAGVLHLECNGESGDTVEIQYGEELNDDGTVRFELRAGCVYNEKWILTDGLSTYEGYIYKGFRYIQLITAKEIEKIEVICQHYPFDDFYCQPKFNDKRVEDIFNLCKYTIKYATQYGFIDCPTREKGQYLGDAFIAGHSYALLTGKTDLLEKCVDDFAQSSRICSGIMAVAPCSLMQEIADYSLLFGELLLLTYRFNGNRAFLEKYYTTAKNIILYFRKYERADGLLDCVNEKWNLVDWPENMRDSYDFSLTRPVVAKGVHNVINAYYIGAIATLNKIESQLGLESSFDFNSLKKSYNKAFKKGSLYADSELSSHCSLHSNALALYFDLSDNDNQSEIAELIVKKGLSCGVYFSYFVMKALAKANYYDELYSLLVNDGEHGWINMIREGATTCFEVWGKEQKHNTSLCHPWATTPVSIILEDLKEYVISENE